MSLTSPHLVLGDNGEISVTQGDNVSFSITVVDASNAAINLAGYSVFFTVKEFYDKDDSDSRALIKKKITTFSGTGNNIATVTLTSTDTDIATKRYKYDIQLVNTSNEVQTVILAGFTVTPQVTNRVV